MGLVVGKKNVPTAVGRNRVKRVVRETFRKTSLPVALDIVFLARKDADKLSTDEMTTLLLQTWAKLVARLNKTTDKVRGVKKTMRKLAIALIRVYQYALSPFLVKTAGFIQPVQSMPRRPSVATAFLRGLSYVA